MSEFITIHRPDCTEADTVPILKRVRLFGVDGFALHYHFQFAWLYTVSHIETGVRVGDASSERAAIVAAKDSVLERCPKGASDAKKRRVLNEAMDSIRAKIAAFEASQIKPARKRK